VSLNAVFALLLNASRDGDSTTSLGSLFQCITTLLEKKSFLTPNLNLPWLNFQELVESGKISLEPSLLQTKQAQFPQPLPTRPVLQTFTASLNVQHLIYVSALCGK